MSSDPRQGIPDSDFHQFTSGDGNASATLLDVRSDALFRIDKLVVDYAGAADTLVQIWDDADGTAVGNLSDQRREIPLRGTGRLTVDVENMRDIEEDVIAEVDGNQDGDVTVTVEGEHIVSGRPAVNPEG